MGLITIVVSPSYPVAPKVALGAAAMAGTQAARPTDAIQMYGAAGPYRSVAPSSVPTNFQFVS